MDRSDEILANPHFARFMAIQEELKSMGYFCISMYSKEDIQEEFTSSFEDTAEPLTEAEIDEIATLMQKRWDKGYDMREDTVYSFIDIILNKRK